LVLVKIRSGGKKRSFINPPSLKVIFIEITGILVESADSQEKVLVANYRKLIWRTGYSKHSLILISFDNIGNS